MKWWLWWDPPAGAKTTAASLIPRFWDVDSGSVTVGGADVRKLDSAALMGQVAFVFQDTRLFKESLLENIRAARPDASREEVLAAAHAAQCDDILEKLPQGLDTVVGARGVYLSGGGTAAYRPGPGHFEGRPYRGAGRGHRLR